MPNDIQKPSKVQKRKKDYEEVAQNPEAIEALKRTRKAELVAEKQAEKETQEVELSTDFLLTIKIAGARKSEFIEAFLHAAPMPPDFTGNIEAWIKRHVRLHLMSIYQSGKLMLKNFELEGDRGSDIVSEV